MKHTIHSLKAYAIFCFLTLAGKSAFPQFNVTGQFIQRSEYRHGYGKLIPEKTDAALFINQRARLEFNYKSEKLRLYSSVQDVRIFGNTSQVKLNDPYFSVHEAFAEMLLDSSFSIKLGRQELVFDNSRFFGNLDWALQGRSHDFVIARYNRKSFVLHTGGGYNQDMEALAGNIFNTTNQYKLAQLIRIEYCVKGFNFSMLFWNDGRQFTVKDSLDKIISKGVRYRQTIGIPTIKYIINNTTIYASYYHQLGKDVNNKLMDAYEASINISQRIHFNKEKKSGITLTFGTEVISGNATNNSGRHNFSFSPLYGTNHAHNGYMDMFFVGCRFENSVGLHDAYLRVKYDLNPKIFISLNSHYFNAYAKVYNKTTKLNPNLGAELDLTMGYKIINQVLIQLGYSQFFNTATMNYLSKVNTPQNIQNWAYLMIVYRPFSDKKFIGLIF